MKLRDELGDEVEVDHVEHFVRTAFVLEMKLGGELGGEHVELRDETWWRTWWRT